MEKVIKPQTFWHASMIVLWSIASKYDNEMDGNQNPSLLLSLDLSTYSWMCSLLTGSSTTSLTLKEAYLEGSKSLGATCTAPFLALHASTSPSYIIYLLPVCSCQSLQRWRCGQRREWRWCWYFWMRLSLPVFWNAVLEWHQARSNSIIINIKIKLYCGI